MNTKAAKGKWAGGKLPYSYDLDPDTHKLVINTAEKPCVTEMFRLYTQDRLGTRAIANHLTSKGITTRSGRPWSAHSVGRALANPAYAGDISHGTVYVRDAHPVIDRDTWQRPWPVSTPRKPNCFRSPSDGPATSTTPGKRADSPMLTRWPCRSAQRKQPSAGTTPRSRTAPWTTPPPDHASPS